MVVDGVDGAEAGAGLADAAGFADCCAFALSLSKRKATITQCRIRISQPKSRFRFSLRPVLRSVIRKVAVVLKFIVPRRLLAWGVLRSATGGCLCFLNVSGAGLGPMSSGEWKFS